MRIRKKVEPVAEGDLTPMIDMVFQLIAFFMVIVNFSQAEQDARVKLPESELAKPPEVPFDEPITLQMDKDANVIIRGDVYTQETLPRRMMRERQYLQALNKTAAQATIVVRAHKDCPTGKVQEVIRICQDKNFEHFALKAKEKSKY